MSSEVPPLPNEHVAIPDMQSNTDEPTTTIAKEQAADAEVPPVNASAAVGGIEESQLIPHSMASSVTNGSVAGLSVASVPATVGVPSEGMSAAPLPPMQDPEVINAINVLKKYPDLAMMSSVGGGMNGVAIAPSAAPAVTPVPSGDGAVQQQPHPQQQQQQHQLPPQQQQQQQQQHQLPPQQHQHQLSLHQQHQYQLPPQQQQQLPPQHQHQLLPPHQHQLLPQQQQQQQMSPQQQHQLPPQQQQQQPQMSYGGCSPAMHPVQYTQLSSALPASQQPSPYQQQRSVMSGYYGGEVVAESLSPHAGGTGMMAGCGPAMHPASFYYDPRHYYATRDDGMMAMQSPQPPQQPPPRLPLLPAVAAPATASYVSRQSSTVVTDAGGYHHSDQVAMFRERPLRPGADNYCYMSRRRSTYPGPYPIVYGVTEEVENFKYRYPDPLLYANPHGMYGNGIDVGHAGPGPYRHVPNGAGGYNNGGGGMMPALEWNPVYAPVAAGMNGNGAAATGTSEQQPADTQSPTAPPSVGSVTRGHALGSAATPASGGQLPQHAGAVGAQVSGTSAAVSSDASGAAVAAGVSAASATSPASPVGGLEKSADESSNAAADGCAAAADSIEMSIDEVSTSANDVLPALSRKRSQATAFKQSQATAIETPRKRLAVAASTAEETRCDSATQAAESSSTGGSNASGRSDQRSAGKKASKNGPTRVVTEAVLVVCQPLETAALRPRKSCIGSMDGGQQRSSAVDGAADATKPVADRTSGPNDNKKKASPMWDIGAIVWARLSGERWWPAMTIEGHMALQKPAEGNCCWVFWYGDHKVSEIASEKIQWFARNFAQRFSSSGGKVYKKAIAEALQECIRRTGYAETDQAPIAEENEHLRSCARQLFEQKGVSNIDKTPGTVTPLVADFLRAIVSRIPATNSPAAIDGGTSSSSSKKASVAPEDGDDDDASIPSKANAAVSGKLSAATSSPSLSSNGSKATSATSTKASTPGSKPPAASKAPSSSAAKPTEGSAKKVAREVVYKSSTGGAAAPESPAASTSSSCSNGGISSSSNGVVSSSTGCPGSDEVKTGHGVSRQQYRALHGKQLDDFFNEVRKGKRMLSEVCIACNGHRKPVVVQHPLIEGGLCDTCKHNVMEALFSYGTDGCNVYCVLCGDGGEVLVCERSGCGKTYCQGCIETLGSPALLKRCLEASPWSCFTCTDEPIVTTDRISLIVRRPDWQVHVSQLFEKPNSDLHRGPSASDFKKKKLRVLSLFDGISTGKLVLDQLGFDIETYYASEIDPDSIIVTTKNHGDSVIQLGDVRQITDEKLASLGRIDLLIGGSPCNDLALVNPTRKGIYDGTGVLFFDFYRILRSLNSLQQGNHVFWLFENVVCMRAETKSTICRFLECEPVNFNAVHFSPQNRARYFWGNLPGLYTPLNPDILNQEITLQSVLTPGFDRKANVEKLRTVTTRTASLKQGHKEEMFPVTMNGSEGRLWPTELERVFGIPDHYTDVGPMGPTKRQKLLGRAWCVPVVKHLLTPLKQFFLLKDGDENAAEVPKQ